MTTATELQTEFKEMTDGFLAEVQAFLAAMPEPEPDVFVNDINVTKAELVLNFIETNPTKHDQDQWGGLAPDAAPTIEDEYLIDPHEQLPLGACDTVGCFAGWTAALSGHLVLTAGNFAGVILDLSPDMRVVTDEDTDDELHPEGPRVTAEHWAQEALGLDRGQALSLFSYSNTRAQLRAMLSDWTDGAIPAERPALVGE